MTAGGQPACTPAPTIGATDRYDDGIGQALITLLGRRRFLEAAAGGAATLLLAACGTGANTATATGTAATSSSAALTSSRSASSVASSTTTSFSSSVTARSAATSASSSAATSSIAAARAASGAAGAPWVYVFNTGSQDVSIIDSTTHKVLSTRPLGAAVRWLSNEQRYWDGQHIWTYDFPGNKLTALSIDPKEMKVVTTVDTATLGPGHSLMLTPDKKTALLNAAGSNVINVIDVAQGKVTDKIDTGKFP